MLFRSGRSIQAKGIDPDIMVEEELPEELKAKIAGEKPRGEASLRGHLKNPGMGSKEDKEKDDKISKAPDAKDGKDAKDKDKEKQEASGSASYVAKEPEKDTQLQYALSFLRGTAKEPPTAGSTTPTPAEGAAPEPSAGATTEPKPSPN